MLPSWPRTSNQPSRRYVVFCVGVRWRRSSASARCSGAAVGRLGASGGRGRRRPKMPPKGTGSLLAISLAADQGAADDDLARVWIELPDEAGVPAGIRRREGEAAVRLVPLEFLAGSSGRVGISRIPGAFRISATTEYVHRAHVPSWRLRSPSPHGSG